jgi:hypothetical protein
MGEDITIFFKSGKKLVVRPRAFTDEDIAFAIQRKITERFPARVFVSEGCGYVEYLDRKKEHFEFM